MDLLCKKYQCLPCMDCITGSCDFEIFGESWGVELCWVSSFFFFSAAPFFSNILDILLIKMETKCILIMYVFSFCQNIAFWDVHHLCHLPAHQLVSINLSFFFLRALSHNEIINIYWHFYLLACLSSVSLSLQYKLKERKALSFLFTMVFHCLEQDVLNKHMLEKQIYKWMNESITEFYSHLTLLFLLGSRTLHMLINDGWLPMTLL